MDTLFDSHGKPLSETRECWRQMTLREFYAGELETRAGELPNFRLSKAIGYPISLTRLQCDASIAYRRSWQHIRRDPAALRVLWFVRRGSMSFTRNCDTFQVGVGECGIVDCNVPFVGRIDVDGTGTFESVQAIVPAQIFLDCIANGARCAGSFELEGAPGAVVESSLDLLCRSGEQLAESTRHALTRALLCALAECVGEHPSTLRPPTVVEKRIADIEQYIRMHLSDPNLTADRVAAGCGISQRYLAHLMRERNNTFSEFLWKHRLPLARDNLLAHGLIGRPISEIAFMSGFKSAAHFCRMFKAAYACTPTEYRIRHRGSAADCADAARCGIQCPDAVQRGERATAHVQATLNAAVG